LRFIAADKSAGQHQSERDAENRQGRLHCAHHCKWQSGVNGFLLVSADLTRIAFRIMEKQFTFCELWGPFIRAVSRASS
jgi:hypothetical protein